MLDKSSDLGWLVACILGIIVVALIIEPIRELLIDVVMIGLERLWMKIWRSEK